MDELADFADRRHGIFNLQEAAALGVTQRMVESRAAAGRYERVAPSTFRIVGASPTWRQSILRAVAAAGAPAAASHATALALHRVVRAGDEIHIVTPRRRRLHVAEAKLVIHTTTQLHPSDLTVVTGIPATTIERSLLDHAGRCHPDALAAAFDRAIAADLTSVPRLAAHLEARRGKGVRGVANFEACLERPLLGQTESRYERILLEMFNAAGLHPVPQYLVRDGDGRFVARVDLAFPSHRVAIEVDGHEFHADRDQRAADAARQNRLHAEGWMVLRTTSDQVFRRDPAIVDQARRLTSTSPFLRR